MIATIVLEPEAGSLEIRGGKQDHFLSFSRNFVGACFSTLVFKFVFESANMLELLLGAHKTT
jgi:hypothetical protein